jgi:uncharacterized membrane protein YdbT with pleckstrin-like domain
MANNIRLYERIKKAYSLAENENIIRVIYKHPLNLLISYLMCLIGFAAVMFGISVLSSSYFTDDSSTNMTVVIVATIVAALMTFLFMAVITFVYRQTRLIISDQHFLQILQQGLLFNKTSRLELTDIEDVSCEQKGFLATIFGFGTLIIETAGELPNFVFTYCPHPNLIAKELIDAKTRLMERTPLVAKKE